MAIFQIKNGQAKTLPRCREKQIMRPFIHLALVLLLSCSAKNDTTEKDIATEAIDDLRPTEPKEVVVDNGYLLGSLLNFDSEEELMKLFHQDITRAVGYYPEGMGEYQNTLLFQGTTNQVEFVWRDDSVNFSGLSFVIVRGKETDWRTAEGITLGTKQSALSST
jgi:hypothetical protein